MQYTTTYQSPVGEILLACDEIGLTGLWFAGGKFYALGLDPKHEEKEMPVFQQAKRWLDIYFSGREPDFMPPVHLTGSLFRLSVWKILQQIPYGETTTYGKIADQIAEERGLSRMSAQAVGGAVGHNPISIIIPCHRVVGTNGNLTGYAGGIQKKIILLEQEGVDMNKLSVPKKGIVRNEKETDYKTVEEITRKAFYNLYVPGCTEHYLVHIMRQHEDFIPELDFVIELDGKVIGNIMYTKSRLVDENGFEKEILTFGPVCVAPEYQRMGYGSRLMEHSFEKAKELGYDVIVIFGSPANYVSHGFKSCKKYNVCLENGKYPAAMMAKELVPGVLDGRKWFFYDSPVMEIDEEEAQKYEDTLEKMEKKYQTSQDEFYIMSNAFLE